MQTLKKLSRTELRNLEKWVQSPIFNVHSAVQNLYAHLRKALDGAALSLSSEAVFEAVFPKEDFDAQKLHYVNSYLLRLTEQYLAWQEWQEEPFEDTVEAIVEAIEEAAEAPTQ